MSTNLHVDSVSCFIREDTEQQLSSPKPSEVSPQYVHHLAPKPQPDSSQTAAHHKDVKQRCVKFAVAAVISLLLLLLLVGVLLAYFYSSSCVHGTQCGDGSCVWDSQWCDGVEDCPAGQDEANCVRLHGSSFLLQIYLSQSWRTVCSHGWTEQQGRTSCQHIGYSRGTYFRSGRQESGSDGGFLKVTSNFRPEVSLLQQLQISDTCPGNSVVTLRCTDCGKGVNSSGASGGQVASPGAWPWQVSLQVSGSHRCGGAIISPYWLVTAAQCVYRTPSPRDWTVYAGILDHMDTLFNPAHSVSHIIAHEGYSSVTHRNNIALMRLRKPLDITTSGNIGPVCLPNVGLNFSDHQMGWITRFSGTDTGVSGSLHLMEAQVSLIKTAECNSSAAYNGKITQDMFCAEEMKEAAGVCHTDSGGPLTTLNDDVWWLLGDSIWGEGCTEKKAPGVYGNVTYFLDWIYFQMRKHQGD
ncbi:uncharacterized protein V6R79_012400 [Siganus canaliculatus]